MVSGCFCRRTKPTWTLHASVCSVRWPPEYNSASPDGDISAVLRASIALNPLLLSGRKAAG